MFFISDSYIDSLIEEDLHLFDVTVAALDIANASGMITCYPKQNCVVAGIEEAARSFARAGAKPEVLRNSGYEAEAGDVCLRVTGTASQLHGVYKMAQNIMEFSSGIATRCAGVLKAARAKQPHIQVAVTRKHAPGTKRLSLKAALAGGAVVHRFGLTDSILIFDQHRVFLGGTAGFLEHVGAIIQRCPEKKIAVEANTPEEAVLYAKAGVHIVQCERFSPDTMRHIVPQLRAANPLVKVLSAGGVNADNAAAYADTGIDVLVTSWPFFGKPQDIKMEFTAGA